MVRAGKVPCRIGDGINDYVYIDNLVDAIVACGRTLADGPSSKARGRAYFINDYQANICTHPQLKPLPPCRPLNSSPRWNRRL